MQKALEELVSIAILVGVIGFVIARLPKVDLGHTPEFRARRVRNWLPVGLLYALLYMGRYNLTVSKDVFGEMLDAAGQPLMSNADFGTIFGVGTAVYGFAFVLNGPLTDRFGGKAAILVGASGSIVANLAMGALTHSGVTDNLVLWLCVLYGINMYFQSFGAVAIVKINAPWFHVRERGTFGAIFGILISLGVYLALDVGKLVVDVLPLAWVFYAPALLLMVLWLVVAVWVRNSPAEAGHSDFDTADESAGADEPRLPVRAVFAKILSHPIIMTIACIEFCSGFLRQAIMQWYRTYAKATGLEGSFVYDHWGMLSCCAGILGGVFAGVISDRLFGSRRGPVSAVLYGFMVGGAVLLTFSLGTPMLGPLVVFMSMCVIGVHGMLSGTASMDFGGRKNTGVAVGIIDGFVYAGTAAMSFTYGAILPDGAAAQDVSNWLLWPIAMVPMALLGYVLARRVWHAMPRRSAGH